MAKLDKVQVSWENRLSRRNFLRASAMGITFIGISSLMGVTAGCGILGGGTQEKQMEKLKLQLNWVKDVESAGIWAAMEKGYYKEEGIEIEALPGGPQADPTTLVAGGGALLGRAGSAQAHIMARLQGVPVKAFATTFQSTPSGLMSLAKAPIKTVQDVVGKRIGLQTGARGPWAVIIRKAGIPEDKVKIVGVGVDPTPLVTGEVDGYWCYVTSQPLTLKAKGIDVYVVPSAELGLVAYGDFFFTTDDVLKNKKDVVIRWLRATIRGWEYNDKHPDEIAKLTVEKYGASGLNLDQQTQVNKLQIPYLKSPLTEKKGICWMEASVWQQTVKDLYDTKQIDRMVSTDDLMTLEILDKAYGGKPNIPL
ncbi:MAG: ABC transporter substrate-binding protein [Desulfitobacteriaceae bacterium]